MKKSEYSGRFGDYSTYSEEADHLSDIVTDEEAAAEAGADSGDGEGL